MIHCIICVSLSYFPPFKAVFFLSPLSPCISGWLIVTIKQPANLSIVLIYVIYITSTMSSLYPKVYPSFHIFVSLSVWRAIIFHSACFVHVFHSLTVSLCLSLCLCYFLCPSFCVFVSVSVLYCTVLCSILLYSHLFYWNILYSTLQSSAPLSSSICQICILCSHLLSSPIIASVPLLYSTPICTICIISSPLLSSILLLSSMSFLNFPLLSSPLLSPTLSILSLPASS